MGPQSYSCRRMPHCRKATLWHVMVLVTFLALGVAGCASHVTFDGCSVFQVRSVLEKVVEAELRREVDLQVNRTYKTEYRGGFIFESRHVFECVVETSGPQVVAKVSCLAYPWLSLTPVRVEHREHRILGLVTEAILRDGSGKVVEGSSPLFSRLRPIPYSEEADSASVVLLGVTCDEVVRSIQNDSSLLLVGPGFKWQSGEATQTTNGITARCHYHVPLPLADTYTWTIEAEEVTGGVRVRVRGTVNSLFSNGYLGGSYLRRCLRCVVIRLLDRMESARLAEPASSSLNNPRGAVPPRKGS